jgi:hypothetical protein
VTIVEGLLGCIEVNDENSLLNVDQP